MKSDQHSAIIDLFLTEIQNSVLKISICELLIENETTNTSIQNEVNWQRT